LTETLGPINYTTEQSEVFLGRSMGKERECSEQTVYQIDQEVRKVVDRNYQRAKQVLSEHMDQLHAMADALMKYETIDKDQIADIMSGKPARPALWERREGEGAKRIVTKKESSKQKKLAQKKEGKVKRDTDTDMDKVEEVLITDNDGGS
jgi:cell division protease FtsH